MMRLFDGLAGRALFACATTDRSGRQQGTSSLEWTVHASVLGQRPFERLACSFDVAAGLAEQPAAASGRGERPWARGTGREILIPLEPGFRRGEIARADHRLDRVGPSEVRRLAPAVRIQPGGQV